MYFGLAVIVLVVGLVRVESVLGATEPALKYSKLPQWRCELSSMYGKIWQKGVTVESTSAKLRDMNKYETSPEFLKLVKSSNDLKFTPRVFAVFKDSRLTTFETSLMHKSKRLSEKLADILTNHQGCSYDEISKIARVQKIFREGSRIETTIDKKLEEELIYCWDNYRKLIGSVIHLSGNDDLETVANLHQTIDIEALNAYAKCHYDVDPAAFESLSHSIASYMITLDHPYLESIPTNNRARCEIQLKELYKVEVYEPCAKLCNLFRPVKKYFSGLSESNIDKMKHLSKLSSKNEILLQFSCNLSSFVYSSLGSRIWHHYLNLKNKL